MVSRKYLQILAAISILFFLGTFAWLISATNLCSSCSASQLWRYSVLASVPTYMLAFVPITGRRATFDIEVPVSGILSLVVIACATLLLALRTAPTFIFESFAQTYDIFYFQSLHFPFASGMIVLLPLTLGLMSFNVAVAVREPLKSARNWSLKGCWGRVVRNFAMFLGLVLLIHSYVASSNSLAVFSVMMASMIMVPMFSLYSWIEKRHFLVRILIGGGALLSVVEVIPHLMDLIGLMIPSHPFTVIPVFSLFLVCIGCTIGEIGIFVSHPINLSRRGLFACILVIVVMIIFLWITWTFTHAGIVVVLGLTL